MCVDSRTNWSSNTMCAGRRNLPSSVYLLCFDTVLSALLVSITWELDLWCDVALRLLYGNVVQSLSGVWTPEQSA
jgi:hypothetical protein